MVAGFTRMPSKDPINEKANVWLYEEGAPLSSTVRTSRASTRGSGRQMSAQILRLADRLEKDADELAAQIPADTLRRTKYPVIEVVNPDGTRTFSHDPQIQEGRLSAAR